MILIFIDFISKENFIENNITNFNYINSVELPSKFLDFIFQLCNVKIFFHFKFKNIYKYSIILIK